MTFEKNSKKEKVTNNALAIRGVARNLLWRTIQAAWGRKTPSGVV